MDELEKLLQTVDALRDPENGCPWDIEQTHQSIADCLIDECCELLQTIDRGDMDHMEEELGDVLLQVLMHAQMAKESGHFDFRNVCAVVKEKLVRRHPHVFGDSQAEGTDAVLTQWEKIKAAERKRGPTQSGRFKELPRQLPALLYARDVLKQLEKQQLDASAHVEQSAIRNEREDAIADEAGAGKRLFAIVAACRRRGIDPEAALRRHAQGIVDALEGESE